MDVLLVRIRYDMLARSTTAGSVTTSTFSRRSTGDVRQDDECDRSSLTNDTFIHDVVDCPISYRMRDYTAAVERY